MSANGERSKLRVAIWGAGGVARCLIRECLRRPEVEIVGVYARSREKDGRDAGVIYGDEPAGVLITTDKEAIYQARPDVLLHVPRTSDVDFGSEILEDIKRFLRGGTSVISSAAYHYPTYSSSAVVRALEEACREGKAAIHATGINPGLLCERWVVGLTAGMTTISSIKVQELADVAAIPSLGMLQSIGIGATPESLLNKSGSRYFGEAVSGACERIGYKVERVEHSCVGIAAKQQISLPLMTIEPGQNAAIIHQYIGIVDERPFFTLEEYMFVDPAACPISLDGAPYVATATIEAEPTSVAMRVALQASIVENRGLRTDGTRPTYNTTAAAMLNAIPYVLEATPGIVYARAFGVHRPDLRIKPIVQ
ncbi:MAG: hypothetical protein ABW199_07185 [Caulobacterales bacterium]